MRRPAVTPDSAKLGRVWPLLQPGDYWGLVEGHEVARSAFQPRKRRDGQPRQEWRLYLHIPLVAGVTSETSAALAGWRERHEGRSPQVFWAARFTTLPNQETPQALGGASKLHKALSALKGAHVFTGELVRFSDFEGRYVKVRVRDSDEDQDGDPVPEAVRYSVAGKILEILPRGVLPTCNLAPATKHQVPTTTYQHPVPVTVVTQELAAGTEADRVLAARSNGVGPPACARGNTDRAGEGRREPPSLAPTPGSRSALAVLHLLRQSDAALSAPEVAARLDLDEAAATRHLAYLAKRRRIRERNTKDGPRYFALRFGEPR